MDKKKIRQMIFLSKENIGKPEYCNDGEVYACMTDRENAKIMYYTQKSSEYNDETTHKGLHTFVEVVAHENHHITLWNYFWPSGYHPDNSGCADEIGVPNADCDNDYYPSWFEISNEGKKYGFNPTLEQDAYGFRTRFSSTWRSAGYIYEEEKCRGMEHLNSKGYDQFDWSYDRFNLFQGKKW